MIRIQMYTLYFGTGLESCYCSDTTYDNFSRLKQIPPPPQHYRKHISPDFKYSISGWILRNYLFLLTFEGMVLEFMTECRYEGAEIDETHEQLRKLFALFTFGIFPVLKVCKTGYPLGRRGTVFTA